MMSTAEAHNENKAHKEMSEKKWAYWGKARNQTL
jgi:hypothetical protein